MRSEYPGEFSYHVIKMLWRRVDDGVPADSGAERMVGDWKSGERSLLEGDTWVGLPGHVEHRRRHVNTDDFDVLTGQERRHTARPAANIGHTTRRVPCNQLDEGGDQRAVDRALSGGADLSADELCVRLSCGVVHLSGRRNVVRLSHLRMVGPARAAYRAIRAAVRWHARARCRGNVLAGADRRANMPDPARVTCQGLVRLR